MADTLKTVGEWTGFGIKKQTGHWISLPTESGNTFSSTEVNVRRTATILGLGGISYTVWDMANNVGLI